MELGAGKTSCSIALACQRSRGLPSEDPLVLFVRWFPFEIAPMFPSRRFANMAGQGFQGKTERYKQNRGVTCRSGKEALGNRKGGSSSQQIATPYELQARLCCTISDAQWPWEKATLLLFEGEPLPNKKERRAPLGNRVVIRRGVGG